MIVILIRSEHLCQIFLVILIWPNYIFQKDISLLKLVVFSSVFYLNHIAVRNNMTKENWVCLDGRNIKKSTWVRDT